ncbi:hypothetical protein D3C73_883720 [compost metagenome]
MHKMEKLEEEITRPTIAVSGASGSIGQQLLKLWTGHAHMIALSRNCSYQEKNEHIEWRSCDFYSLDDAERGLVGVDYAVYLIHSKLQSARLTQGKFEDMDVILAVHFARAALKNGVKQIIYLSEFQPPHISKIKLARHVQSSLEIEHILGSYGIPVTTIRDGSISGSAVASLPRLITETAKGLLEQEQTSDPKKLHLPPKSDVRSVQRFLLPAGKDASWAASYYVSWLSSFVKPFLKVELDDQSVGSVNMFLSRKPLLELTYSHQKSTSDYAVYQITGGLFVNTKDSNCGRLEFLQIPGTQECVVAIHDFIPALPWFIYKNTQAIIHLAVMYAFKKHLLRLIQKGE